MSLRKRKAEDDDNEMTISPTTSPTMHPRQLTRPYKKIRAGSDIVGRSLSLPRLLETLDNTQLRTVLQIICERHPQIGHEVVGGAPKPSVAAALLVLEDYQKRLRDAFPYGATMTDYSFDRVKKLLVALIQTVSEFTLQFLPPVEQQTNFSLQYLDGATKVIHQLPDWDNVQNRHYKNNAYDEISRAWLLVISEASKRAGGFALRTSGWDQILTKHNQQSGGRLEQAMSAMTSLGWDSPLSNNAGGSAADQSSILSQIMNGNYGAPVRVGW